MYLCSASPLSDLQSSERHQPSSLSHKFTPPPAHAGVKLHPPRNPTLTLQSPSARRGTPPQRSASAPPPQKHSFSAPEAQRTRCKAACDGEDDLVPVRDGDAGCSLKESCGPEESCCRGRIKAETVRCLLEELRALIAGQGALRMFLIGLVSLASSAPDQCVCVCLGSVAEKLLNRLGQTVGGSDIQDAPLSANPQVCRYVLVSFNGLHTHNSRKTSA